MAFQYWPFFDLRLRTGRLELRPPTDGELEGLARLTAAGIHDPAVMPFAVPWTDVPPGELERSLLQYHWAQRGALRPDDWNLELAVWVDGQVAGSQSIRSRSFAVERTVETGSWLGRAFQGRGIGREMRAAVLELAFVGLGAEAAFSGAFADNVASCRVSRALGYHLDSVGEKAPRGVLQEHHRFRLDRATWMSRPNRPEVVWEGLAPCLPFLGASGP
jgi:RimJ/RimL family protein N-acetyltransferase